MNINLADAFSEFTELKGLDRPTQMRVMEDVFRTLIRKKYGTDDNFDVIVNTEKGDLEIWRVREVVEQAADVEDELRQIPLRDAQLIDTDYSIGDDCYQPIGILDFGRRAIQAAKQTLQARITELEKDEVFRRYNDRVGDFVVGEVSQVLKKELYVLDDATGKELMLPRTEMIRGDFYRKGEMVRAVIKKVEMKNNTPVVVLSRTDDAFLQRLLEQEVPEIEEGIITIKKVVRQPGERAKIAVETFDERVDPVGACVGVKGQRIHGIVRELRNENIDVINYTNNVSLFIQRALTPAKVSNIDVNVDKLRASVHLRPDEVSKAIGKAGLNIRLASKLTGYEIDVFREQSENDDELDVELDEFSDEIDQWILDEFKNIGCDTAKSVLSLSRDELIRRTDLEEETIDDVIRILNDEFKD